MGGLILLVRQAMLLVSLQRHGGGESGVSRVSTSGED